MGEGGAVNLEAAEPADTTVHCFASSADSRVGRLLSWGARAALAVLAVAVLALHDDMSALLAVLVPWTLIVVPGWLLLRNLLKPGQVVLRVDAGGIASPLFRGARKRYAWTEVSGVAQRVLQGAWVLELQLNTDPARPDRRSFWSGRNPARPFLLLTVFDDATRAQIIDTVVAALAAHAAASGRDTAGMVDELAAEQQFAAELRALAPVPWVTWGLCAANVLVWLATLALGADFAGSAADKLLQWGGNAASEVQRGQWWRLLSATFLHSGFVHLAMNMVGLLAAGVTVERIYGHRLFILLYLAAGLSGSALSLHFSAQSAVSVGASGAVFGITGALLVAVLQHRHRLPAAFSAQMLSGVGFFIFYSLLQGFARADVDNAAHIGGLLGGCVLAALLPERFDPAHFAATFRRRALAAVLLTALAVGGLAALAPPAAVDQVARVQAARALDEAMATFQEAVAALQADEARRQAGEIGERELDVLGRTVHGPAFRIVQTQLQAVELDAGHPLGDFLVDIRRMTELLVEALEMDTIYSGGGLRAADPLRMAAIEAELAELAARMQRRADEHGAAR